MNTFGERLRQERERLGMNQDDFGEVGGVRKLAQINYEKSERHPDAKYLTAINEIGVDLLYLFTGIRTPVQSVLSSVEIATAIAYKLGKTPEQQREVQETVFNSLHELYKKQNLSDDEAQLLANYRQCPPEGKAAIKATSSAFAAQQSGKKEDNHE